MDVASLPPDHNKGPMAEGLLWAFNGLAAILIALRAYTRIKTGAQGWDDYVAYFALIVITFYSITVVMIVNYGFGRHFPYVSETFSEVLKWMIGGYIQNFVAVFAVKLSVCLFILRVIGVTHRRTRYFIYLLIVVVAGIMVASVLIVTLQCFPLEKVWNLAVPGTCASFSRLALLTKAFGILGFVTDLACVLIPISIFRSLQMSQRTQHGLCAVIGLGLITAACALGKAVTANFTMDDPTWNFVPLVIWGGMESHLGLCVACLPALRQLFSIGIRNKSQDDPSSKSHDRKSLHKSRFFDSKSAIRAWHGKGTEASTKQMDQKQFVQLSDMTMSQGSGLGSVANDHTGQAYPHNALVAPSYPSISTSSLSQEV